MKIFPHMASPVHTNEPTTRTNMICLPDLPSFSLNKVTVKQHWPAVKYSRQHRPQNLACQSERWLCQQCTPLWHCTWQSVEKIHSVHVSVIPLLYTNTGTEDDWLYQSFFTFNKDLGVEEINIYFKCCLFDACRPLTSPQRLPLLVSNIKDVFSCFLESVKL